MANKSVQNKSLYIDDEYVVDCQCKLPESLYFGVPLANNDEYSNYIIVNTDTTDTKVYKSSTTINNKDYIIFAVTNVNAIPTITAGNASNLLLFKKLSDNIYKIVFKINV